MVESDDYPHHEVWGSTDTNMQGAVPLLSYLIEEDLVMLNKGAEPTVVTFIKTVVLDIPFSNGLMRRWTQDWRVSDQLSMSDYWLIRVNLRGENGLVVWLRNCRRTMIDSSRSSIKRRLPDFLEK